MDHLQKIKATFLVLARNNTVTKLIKIQNYIKTKKFNTLPKLPFPKTLMNSKSSNDMEDLHLAPSPSPSNDDDKPEPSGER